MEEYDTESTEPQETQENYDEYEGQDIPTHEENYEYDEYSHENTLDNFNDQTEDNFDIPTDDIDDIDFDSMSDEQLDSFISQIESEEIDDEDGEYQLPEKFNDVESLVKSYQMLESKIGNFKGAPEEYHIDGVDMDSPLMAELAQTAKELNMSNEGFEAIVSKYNEVQQQMNEIDTETEMHNLGANAETRINNINNYLNNNVAPDVADAIRNMATSAESIRAIEYMIQSARPSGPATGVPTQAPQQDIVAMMNATDEFGSLKMETDSAYHDKVMALMHQQW